MTGEEPAPRPRRHTRAIVITLAVLVAVGAVGFVLMRGQPPPAPTGTRPAAMERLVRTTLVEAVSIDGTIGYGQIQPLPNHVSGVVTSVAAIGATIARGGILYTVDIRPVILLHGDIPAFRAIGPGTSGVDVHQLEKNLAELGHTGFTVDQQFGSGTAVAIRRWQRTLGLPETGVVELGRVVFLPHPVRVAQVNTRPGEAAAASSPVLSYTGTDKRVVAQLDVTDRQLAKVGEPVSVVLPGARSVPATIVGVATVAAAEQGRQSNAQTPTTPTVEVTCAVADQGALGELDAVPVKVQVASRRRESVLAAPVSALLALSEGGYGVRVVDGGTRRVVRVDTGLFARGMVEVTGEGLTEGTVVEVAAP